MNVKLNEKSLTNIPINLVIFNRFQKNNRFVTPFEPKNFRYVIKFV